MRRRMLIVDDEKSILFALQAFFEKRGFTVDCASSSSQALRLASRHSYDAAILDLQLSHLRAPDGLLLAEELRALRPGMPLILLTAGAAEEWAERARQAGFQMTLQKPLALSTLAAAAVEVMACPPTGAA